MECKRKGKCRSLTPLTTNDRETADQILTDIIDITVSTPNSNHTNGPTASVTNLSPTTAPTTQKFTGLVHERPSTKEFIEKLNQSQERELPQSSQETNATDVMGLKSLPSDLTLRHLLQAHNDRIRMTMRVELSESNVPIEAKQDFEITALQQTEGEVCAATCSHHHQCTSPGVISTAGATDLSGGNNNGAIAPPNSVTDTTAPDSNVDAASTESTRSIGSLVCRICHNGENPEKLVSPCLCKGSLSYVHVHCLERWISTSRSTVCELCQFQYNTEQTLRYTCLQSLRMWYSRAMSRRALQEDCQMFSLLTLVAFGIVGTLLVGIQYYLMQARNMGLGRIWTKGWLLFFLFTTLAVYFMNVYMIVRSQLAPWYRWWQSARDIKLILENRKPFTVRPRAPTAAIQDAEAPPPVATVPIAVPILEEEEAIIQQESSIVTPPPSPTSGASQIDLVPHAQPSTVYFLKDTDRELLPLQEPTGNANSTNLGSNSNAANLEDSDTSSTLSVINALDKDLQGTVESGEIRSKYTTNNANIKD